MEPNRSITVFIRLSAQGAYLIFGLSGWALIRGWALGWALYRINTVSSITDETFDLVRVVLSCYKEEL